MTTLDAAMRTVMTADTGSGGVNHSSTGATGGFHQLDAPQGTLYPYVVFQEASDVPGYAMGNALKFDHVFYMIRAFAKDSPTDGGAIVVGSLADRLKVLFTNPSLSVSGKTIMSCRFDRSFPPLKEKDRITSGDFVYSRGVLVEVWLG